MISGFQMYSDQNKIMLLIWLWSLETYSLVSSAGTIFEHQTIRFSLVQTITKRPTNNSFHVLHEIEKTLFLTNSGKAYSWFQYSMLNFQRLMKIVLYSRHETELHMWNPKLCSFWVYKALGTIFYFNPVSRWLTPPVRSGKVNHYKSFDTEYGAYCLKTLKHTYQMRMQRVFWFYFWMYCNLLNSQS